MMAEASGLWHHVLASDAASLMTGSIVLADGGRSAFVDVGFDHQVAELRLPAPNYAFKPSAEQPLRLNRGITCRAGLTRR